MDDQAYVTAREQMVHDQLASRQIKDERVLEAMRRVPRHLFIPPEQRDRAYDDTSLPIGLQQTISQPLMVAIMAEMLKLTGTEKVLDVGTGSGYQAAVLSELAARVISIERHPELALRARQTLEQSGYTNVDVVEGDGTEGYLPEAPYDRIIVAAAWIRIPPPLIDQLAPNGRLIMPVGPPKLQTLTVVTKDDRDQAFIHEHGGCVFVPLIGAQGRPSEPAE